MECWGVWNRQRLYGPTDDLAKKRNNLVEVDFLPSSAGKFRVEQLNTAETFLMEISHAVELGGQFRVSYCKMGIADNGV